MENWFCKFGGHIHRASAIADFAHDGKLSHHFPFTPHFISLYLKCNRYLKIILRIEACRTLFFLQILTCKYIFLHCTNLIYAT